MTPTPMPTEAAPDASGHLRCRKRRTEVRTVLYIAAIVITVAPTSAQTSPAPTPPPTAPIAFNPQDAKCREYLRKFLTGTTDARDECQGLQDAYAAVDCTATAGGDEIADDPWKRWRHDLIWDDDDFPTGGGGEGGGGSFLGEAGSNGDPDDGEDEVPTIDNPAKRRACCASIRSYHEMRCENQGQEVDTTVLLIISSILVVCGIVRALLRSVEHPIVRSCPEAAGCILTGAIAGLVVRWGVPDIDLDRTTFDEDLFLSVFLPPIIFQATLAIDKKALGRNAVPVATFAILGTLLSAVLTSAIVYAATMPLANPIPALDCAVFGALISSIDPVPALGVLSAAGFAENDTLYVLVFGESLFNDAVAIVLFRVLLNHLHSRVDHDSLGAFVGVIASRFLVVSLGSLLLGLAVGVACALYFRALRGRQVPVVEVGTFFVWALVPYYLGELAGYSSVIAMMAALFFADVFVIGRRGDTVAEENTIGGECENGSEADNTRSSPRDVGDIPVLGSLDSDVGSARCLEHGAPRFQLRQVFSTSGQLSPASRSQIGFVAEVVSSLMETIIFAYLGLFLFANKDFNPLLAVIAIVACVGSRAVMVASLSFVLNLSRIIYRKCGEMCQREQEALRGLTSAGVPASAHRPPEPVLNGYMQKILFLSGIRGAVSLALVESIPVFNAVAREGSKYKVELKVMTMSSILFTVFVFGSATHWFVHREGSGGLAMGRRGREGGSGGMTEPLLEGELSVQSSLEGGED